MTNRSRGVHIISSRTHEGDEVRLSNTFARSLAALNTVYA